MYRVIVLVAGCATTSSVGAQGIGTTQTGSVEATAAVGAGFGDHHDAIDTKVQGTFGGGPRGPQGRIMISDEVIVFGDAIGWQLHVGAGASLGNYQHPDLTLEFGGGPHWNLSTSSSPTEHKCIAVALDAIVGYAFQHFDEPSSGPSIPFRSDGAFFGLSLSIRRDQVEMLGHAPFD